MNVNPIANKIKVEFKMEVSYRTLAKALAYDMPLDGQEYSDLIEWYIKSIEAMPSNHQETLRAAYVFSRKAPKEDWRDLFQHFVAHGLEILNQWPEPIRDIAAFCYVVVRNEWKRVTRERKRHIRMLKGGVVSLNKIVPSAYPDGDGREVELQELLAGKLEWTTRLDYSLEREITSTLGSQAVLETLPDGVKAIVKKRLLSGKLSGHEYERLARYREENGKAIRELITA
ncbi:hypothetical protein ES705_11110 [subsurface metagenome]